MTTASYAFVTAGVFILFISSQILNLGDYISTSGLSNKSNRSLQSVSAVTSGTKQPRCLHSTPRFKGIKVYSQNDEDGILLHLLRCMGGHGTREYFEFGGSDGQVTNTRILREHYGWKGHMLDGGYDIPEINLHKEYFTPSNIVQLMTKYKVKKTLDVLSVDTDCDDLWITREILVAGYKPRILITEYNPNFDSSTAVSTLPKEIGKEGEKHCWGSYHGASAFAFHKLLRAFGYTLVHSNGVNLFFVQNHMALGQGLDLPSYNDVMPPLEKKNKAELDGGFSRSPLSKNRRWAFIDDKAAEVLCHSHLLSHRSIKKMMEESSVELERVETDDYRFFTVKKT